MLLSHCICGIIKPDKSKVIFTNYIAHFGSLLYIAQTDLFLREIIYFTNSVSYKMALSTIYVTLD